MTLQPHLGRASVRPKNTATPLPDSSHAPSHRLIGTGLLVAFLITACCFSLATGSKAIPLSEVLIAFQGNADEGTAYVIWDMRFPRTIVAILVGSALGIAGALIQAFSRNPLADPGILGVNAGAAFFVVLGIGVFHVTSIGGYIWFALAGAFFITLLVYRIGTVGRGGADPVRLTLAGVALGAVLSGIVTALMLLDPDTFNAMRSWNAGSVVGLDLPTAATVLPFFLAGLLIAAVVARPLNAIALGDDLAAGLGANVARTRFTAVVGVTLLAGGATALAGPIGFIGLIVPHIARWIVGPNQPWIITYSALIGPILVVTADVIARVVLAPDEVPVGIVTAFVGAPVLIALVRRKKASGL